MKKTLSLCIIMVLLIVMFVPLSQATGERETALTKTFWDFTEQKTGLQRQILEIDKQLLRIEGAVAEARINEAKIAKEAEAAKIAEVIEGTIFEEEDPIIEDTKE